MAVRLDHTVAVSAYRDTARKDKYFEMDLTLAKVTSDDHTAAMGGTFTVAASGTESLTFGDVTTVAGYYVEIIPATGGTIPSGCLLNVNAVGTIPFSPSLTTGEAIAFHTGGPITSIAITNGSGTASISGRYVVWGV